MGKTIGKKKVNKSNAAARKAALIAEYKANRQKDTPQKKPGKANVKNMMDLYMKNKNEYLETGNENARKEALNMLIKAAEAGSGNACYNLSVEYVRGRLTQKDPDKCMYWMEKCAEKLPLTGNFWLGKYYAQGDPVPADREKAKQYLRRSIACEPQSANQKMMRAWGKFELAMLSEGQEAYQLMKESADEGYPTAQKALKYMNGSDSLLNGIMKKVFRKNDAFRDIMKNVYALAEQNDGNELAPVDAFDVFNSDTISKIGDIFSEYEDISKDPFSADHPFHKNYIESSETKDKDFRAFLDSLRGKDPKEILEQLADITERRGSPLSYTMRALSRYAQDPDGSIELLKKAADQGEYIACYLLGLDHMSGDHVQADQEEAVRLFTIAKDKGYPDAFAFLAHQYYFGLGVRGDADYAMKLLKQADTYYDEETCERIEDGLKALYRRRKTSAEIYPFWFMRGEDPVSIETIVKRVSRRMIEDEVAKATGKAQREIMDSLKKLEIITMDTNIRIRGVEASLSDLQMKLADEKRLLGPSGEEEQMYRFFERMESYIRKQTEQSGEAVKKKREYLSSLYGGSWNVLCEESRSALVSALVLMEQCEGITDPSFDYSGICISATSALEGEMKRIFSTLFTDYMHYAGTEEDEIEFIGKRIGKGNSFTLGSLPFALGVSDKQPESVRSRIRTWMIPYLHEILVTDRPDVIALFTEGEDHSFLSRSEFIRESYRNKAAHFNTLPKETAQACIRDVVGDAENEGFLRQMLGMIDYAKAESWQ